MESAQGRLRLEVHRFRPAWATLLREEERGEGKRGRGEKRGTGKERKNT